MIGAPRAAAVLAELWRLSAGTVLVARNLAFQQHALSRKPLPGRVAAAQVPARHPQWPRHRDMNQ